MALSQGAQEDGVSHPREPRYNTEADQQSLLQKQMEQLGLQQQTLQALHTKELQMLRERVTKSERLLLLLSEEVERLDSPGRDHAVPKSMNSPRSDGVLPGPTYTEKLKVPEPSYEQVEEPSARHREENVLKTTAPRASEYRPTGFLKISEVNSSGKFIRIFNSSRAEKADLSGCVIQQWVGGHPVALFRFPLKTELPPLQHITIWASANEVPCESPTELHWKEQLHFKTGPDCTTLLTRPSGQPIDWYRAPHRVSSALERKEDASQQRQSQLPSPTISQCPPSEAKGLYTPKQELAAPPLWRNRARPPSAPSSLGQSTHGEKMDSSSSTCLQQSARTRSWDCLQSGSFSVASGIPSTACSLSFRDGLSSSSSGLHSSFRHNMEFQTRLNTKSPMVALLAQKSARSKYGFKFLSYPPFTVDVHVNRR
ncbi:lamin tail domain-containing protein 2-like isoform X2 [Ambystoma mexicanum]|uniref:lamin tail domain-containing protein 2-like isoform X2 n=1 Tax=Ambystoma mexicanum TaxID=8296 RepID=UPI0037E79686